MILLCLYLLTVVLAGFFAYKGTMWDLESKTPLTLKSYLIALLITITPFANLLFISYGLTTMKKDYNKSSWRD